MIFTDNESRAELNHLLCPVISWCLSPDMSVALVRNIAACSCCMYLAHLPFIILRPCKTNQLLVFARQNQVAQTAPNFCEYRTVRRSMNRHKIRGCLCHSTSQAFYNTGAGDGILTRTTDKASLAKARGIS